MLRKAMSTVRLASLDSLAPAAPTVVQVDALGVPKQPPSNSWAMGLLFFVILVVIIWLIIYATKPSWASNPNGTLNTGKALWSSIIIALVVLLIIWLVKSISGANRMY
jgi:uncharacterized membrane protein (DUF485 family)